MSIFFISDVTCVGDWSNLEGSKIIKESNLSETPLKPKHQEDRILVVRGTNTGKSYCINYSVNQIGLSDPSKKQNDSGSYYNVNIFDEDCTEKFQKKGLLFNSDELIFNGPCQSALTDVTTISLARRLTSSGSLKLEFIFVFPLLKNLMNR